MGGIGNAEGTGLSRGSGGGKIPHVWNIFEYVFHME